MIANIPPPPSSVPISHPLQDHCRFGRGFISLSDITLDEIPLHRIVLCQSGMLKRYFMEHPDVKELDSNMLFNSSTDESFSREVVEIALTFVYATDTMSPILRDEEIITMVFRWLLKLEFYSTLQYVCKSIDASVKESIYFRIYGDLLLVPNFGRSSWDNTNLTEIQNNIESKIATKLQTNQEIINNGIRDYGFAQMVALIERILHHHLELSHIVRIICEWAKDNEERTQNIGDLLMICDNAIKTIPPIVETVVPKPPVQTIVVRQPVAGLRPVPLSRPPPPPPVFSPPKSLRITNLFDSDSDDDDEW